MSKKQLNQFSTLHKRIFIQTRACVFAIALVGVGALPVVVKASTNTESSPVTLEQILQRVREYQDSQGIWKTQQKIAEANIHNSKLWTNPSLNIEQAGFSNNQDKEFTIGVSQPLDIFGQKKAQQKMARLSRDQLGLKQKIYDEQLQLIVKYSWSQVMLSEVEASLLMEQLKVSEESLNIAERRFRAGSIAQVDVDRVKLTHIENMKLVQQAGLRLQTARKQLAHLWGAGESRNVVGRDITSFWPPKVLEKVNANLLENLIEKSQNFQILEAKAQVESLRAEARPNPDVNLSVKKTKTPQNESDDQVTLGVTIPLAIFNRNQYGIQVAQAKENLIEKQKQFSQTQNKRELYALLGELDGLKEQFNLVSQQQIPLALAIQKKTLAGFQAGKFTVMDVQQATAQLHDVRIQSAQLLKSAWQKAIEIESLSLGIDPSVVTTSDALSQINQNLIQETQALPVIGMGN